MAIEKFIYLQSLGWLLQEYNFRMSHGFQVWKFHLKISPWEEKPCLPRAYSPWVANFSSLRLIFGGEKMSIPQTQPIRKSYIYTGGRNVWGGWFLAGNQDWRFWKTQFFRVGFFEIFLKKKKNLLHPHEDQSKVRRYQGWDKILMITLISSQKSPTPNYSAASVTIVNISKAKSF